MNSKVIEVFDWFDIQTEICKEMGIEEESFRDYDKIVGGEYKDLWHEWMNYFQGEIRNRTIIQNDLGEIIENKIEWVTNDDKEWLQPFIEAVYKVWNDNNIKYVKYSW